MTGFVDFLTYVTDFSSIFPPALRYALVTLGLVVMVSSFFLDDTDLERWCFWGGLGTALVALVTLSIVLALFLVADVEEDRISRKYWRKFLGLDMAEGDDGGNEHIGTGSW